VKKALKIIAIIFAVPVLIIVILSIRASTNENESKKLISQEITRLPLPPTCSEKSREYTSGSLDTTSTWHVIYSCDAKSGDAYNTITSGLTAKGYKSTEDFSIPDSDSVSVFYTFYYASDKYNVEYSFSPGGSVFANNPEALKELPLTDISLHVYRVHKAN
jgi:hypothetical protein